MPQPLYTAENKPGWFKPFIRPAHPQPKVFSANRLNGYSVRSGLKRISGGKECKGRCDSSQRNNSERLKDHNDGQTRLTSTVYKPAGNGFTLTEALFALFVGVFIGSICAGLAGVLHHGMQIQPDDQEQFAVLQIREMVAIARSAQVEEGKLILQESSREETLGKDKNRLVKQPGYEILMERLEDVYFEAKGNKLYLTFKKNGKIKTFQIG